ncbi:MAG: SIMPL domain-containing protein, partial [Alcanivoracaceae bacterium]|nr:SIMPL domain-containing protein [Alcanivoracaceae bacterium]
MSANSKSSALILGLLIFLGLTSLGYLLGSSALKFKEYERTVTVKGLSEREFDADIVIWPIQFSAAQNDLEALYVLIDDSTSKIIDFLSAKGIGREEISFGAPA